MFSNVSLACVRAPELQYSWSRNISSVFFHLFVVTNAKLLLLSPPTIPAGKSSCHRAASVRRIGMWQGRKGLFNRHSDNIYMDAPKVLIHGSKHSRVPAKPPDGRLIFTAALQSIDGSRQDLSLTHLIILSDL